MVMFAHPLKKSKKRDNKQKPQFKGKKEKEKSLNRSGATKTNVEVPVVRVDIAANEAGHIHGTIAPSATPQNANSLPLFPQIFTPFPHVACGIV